MPICLSRCKEKLVTLWYLLWSVPMSPRLLCKSILKALLDNLKIGLITIQISTCVASLFRKIKKLFENRFTAVSGCSSLFCSVGHDITATSVHQQILSEYQFCQSTVTKIVVCSGRREKICFLLQSLQCPLWCPALKSAYKSWKWVCSWSRVKKECHWRNKPGSSAQSSGGKILS